MVLTLPVKLPDNRVDEGVWGCDMAPPYWHLRREMNANQTIADKVSVYLHPIPKWPRYSSENIKASFGAEAC